MSNLQQRGSCEERHCGSCTACCTHLLIPAGIVGIDAKPAGTPCTHVGALGCRIYARRPRTCVKFFCAWLHDGTWPAAWRPDRSGLLCLREWLDDTVPAAAVYETRAGALENAEASEIVSELVRTTAVVAIIDSQERRHRLPGRWTTELAAAAERVLLRAAG